MIGCATYLNPVCVNTSVFTWVQKIGNCTVYSKNAGAYNRVASLFAQTKVYGDACVTLSA